MKKELVKEVARDFIALGSIPFFLLVLVRIWILPNPEFLTQFIIAGGMFLLAFFIFKQNIYSGLALITLIFTSLHYSDLRFTIFASIAYLVLLFSLFYLKEDKKEIFKGILLGIISSAVGYYAIRMIFN